MEPTPSIHMTSIPTTNDLVQVSVGDAMPVGIYQPQDQGQNAGHSALASAVVMQALAHVTQDGPTQAATAMEGTLGAQNESSSVPIPVYELPFAEVASLLDPNMKSSKARKYQICYDEVKRRLEPPEKMSLRSLAAYTRVSRGPASKRSLLESLNVLGLSPSTNTAVSSSFSKLTEGDTAALCKDMKDFAFQYVDYENMAKQLMPESNHVQHWSKIIETRNYLEEMRKCFRDPVNSKSFTNATHGLGPGMLDVALDMVDGVIERQIRILSGNSEPKSESAVQKVRKRMRKPRAPKDNNKHPREGKSRGRGKSKAGPSANVGANVDGDTQSRKQIRLDPGTATAETQEPASMESSVLTLVSVGYETISSGLGTTTTGLA
ncbi:transcription factor AP-2-delta [Clupea harengus]|uniref:Transcription factor AP-2-delta n=1 Tax=Clupea harengus TaxID=7950 RepID=A0A6P3VKT9_CLUHA|nr:transcription factor AP-2-delta [Clupea harengus]